ncbi:hypothetical protein [Yinghuangia seranimata]|uniref:tRNA adenosine deaminase-associated protein n=1 Tax=Yinghuangia seranimata TaxID=408067 RepID=UPI00248C3411|nr:hypothetical protein [Yinghuangia seranimata]MDI2127792.1 hypothetical protein [Yinghuangia seranimata]
MDLDDVEDLDGIADLARASAVDEEPVLLLLEQEDLWFAVIRVDGEEDPRIYVSDGAAVARSAYGDTLLTADVLGHDPDDDEEPAPPGPAGDNTVLEDLGVDPDELADLGGGRLPAEALTVIADRLGCADELETVR